MARALVKNISVTPIGSIVAYNPGYYTAGGNVGFTTVGPAGPSVAQANAFLPTNWRVCDGTALNDAGSPIWNAANRYLPDLTGSRFLRGNLTAGGTGGGSVTLVEANLPQHGHSINHDHASQTSLNVSANHQHTIDHDHANQSSTTQSANHTHDMNGRTVAIFTNKAFIANGGDAAVINGLSANSTSQINSVSHSHDVNLPTFFGMSGTMSANHTHDVDLPNFVGTSGISGSDTPFNVVPTYLSTFFIIRVK